MSAVARGHFVSVNGVLTDGDVLRLPAALHPLHPEWGFAIYRASCDDDDSFLPPVRRSDGPRKVFDTVCDYYIDEPAAWTFNPANLRR